MEACALRYNVVKTIQLLWQYAEKVIQVRRWIEQVMIQVTLKGDLHFVGCKLNLGCSNFQCKKLNLKFTVLMSKLAAAEVHFPKRLTLLQRRRHHFILGAAINDLFFEF